MSYTGGEWSPLMDARVDHPKYRSSCRQLKNMVVVKQGAITRRAGTRRIATAKDSTKAVRLIPFKFSPTTAFVLEFGHQYVRFYSNQQQVQVSGSPYELASPYSGVGSPSSTAEIWQITPCQINDVVYLSHPGYPPYKLTRIGDTNWTLAAVEFLTPPVLDQNYTNTLIAASAVNGNITLTASAPAWSTAIYYQQGNSVSQGGVLYECQVSHVAGVFSTDLAAVKWTVQTVFQSGHVGSRWKLSELRDSSQVALDIISPVPPTWVTATNYSVDDCVTNGASKYKCLVANTSGVFATDLAALKWVLVTVNTAIMYSSSISALGEWEFHTYGVWHADIELQRSFDDGRTWDVVRSITGREDRNVDISGKAEISAIYRISVKNWYAPAAAGSTTPRVVFENTDSYNHGVVKITGYTNPYSASATVVTQLNSTTATKYWSEGAWSAVRGYPRACNSFQQRMVYGGTTYEPQRIWGSVTNDLENFDRGDGTLATDSYAFSIGAVGRGSIQWLVSQTDLFCGFAGAEWIINSGQSINTQGASSSITPTAINAVEQSSWGSASGVAPMVVGSAIFYTQRAQRTIQQMLFSINTTKYMSSDLTGLSEHLFGSGIVQIEHQPVYKQQSMVWVVTRSGALMVLSHQPEQEIYAWSRQITGEEIDQGFESVSVINGYGINDDELWCVINRTVNGSVIRSIELLDPTNWETAGNAIAGIPQPQIKNAFYVDSGITVTSPSTSTISGLSHLVARSVIGIINGNMTFGPLTVSGGGTVTIPNYVPVSGDVVQIGLPIAYAAQVMRLDLDPRAGGTNGLNKVIQKLYLRLVNALSGTISDNLGDGGAQPIPINYRSTVTPLGSGPSIFTGEKVIQPRSNVCSTDPTYIVQGSDALPLTLLAVTVKYDVVGTT